MSSIFVINGINILNPVILILIFLWFVAIPVTGYIVWKMHQK